MILCYLKNKSHESRHKNILYICVVFMNPLLLHFLLSKNVKVRLAEYLRYNFDFVILYDKRAKTNIDRVNNCKSE